jgi:hypothetical protein
MQAEQTNVNATNSDNTDDGDTSVKEHNSGNVIDEHDNKNTTKGSFWSLEVLIACLRCCCEKRKQKTLGNGKQKCFALPVIID